MEQLSEDLLKLRPEKAVTDDEVRLYMSYIMAFANTHQGSPEFWEMLTTKLEGAIKKASSND